MKWVKVFDGCWQLRNEAGNPLAIVEQNDFGRRLWTVTIEGEGRIRHGNADCFGFGEAKLIAWAGVQSRREPLPVQQELALV